MRQEYFEVFFLVTDFFYPLVIIISIFFEMGFNQIIAFLIPLILTFIFLITGIMAFYYYHKNGIISTKKIVKWFAKIAVVSAPVFTAVLFLDILAKTTDPDLYLWSTTSYSLLIGLFIGMFLAVFLVLLVFLIIGFGMVGVLTALERGIIPEILLHISRITSSLSNSMKKRDKKGYWARSILRWLFIIPTVLDTQTLTINKGEPNVQFPWSSLKKAVLWQFLLGMIIIIYVSLNPFLLESSSFENLFNISSNISYLIPFIILPWFIFLRLEARIKGPVKNFQLYSGIAYRMYRTFVTLGSIIIIIRLALKNVNLSDVLAVFPIYYFFFSIIILLVTFTYFNYFENDLAKDIAKRFTK